MLATMMRGCGDREETDVRTVESEPTAVTGWRCGCSDLVGEERSDVVEELQLLLQRVTTLLRDVHDVEDGGPQVGQGRDGLHLDGVPLLQGVVQDPRGVHHLNTETAGSGRLL